MQAHGVTGLARRGAAVSAALAGACALAAGAGAAGYPNACTVLTKAHVATALFPTSTVTAAPGKETTYPDGVSCTQTVGSLTVTLGLVSQNYGFGGILHPRVSALKGVGGGAIITGTTAAGKPVATARFRRGPIWVTLSVPGASPSSLQTLSRSIYAALP